MAGSATLEYRAAALQSSPLTRSFSSESANNRANGRSVSALSRCAARSDEMPVARAKGVPTLVARGGPRRREGRRSGEIAVAATDGLRTACGMDGMTT